MCLFILTTDENDEIDDAINNDGAGEGSTLNEENSKYFSLKVQPVLNVI